MGRSRSTSAKWYTSYAACASIAAVLLTTASGALAARKLPTYDGRSLLANTLTTLDVRNRSITAADLRMAKGARGPEGAPGAQGPTGETGPTGNRGDKGVTGRDAARQFSYSYRESGRYSSTVNPNSDTMPWFLRNSISGYVSPVFVTSSGVVMTDLGQAQNSGGVLNLTRTSDLTVVATITLAHRGDVRCADGTAAINLDNPQSSSQTCGSYMNGPTPTEADDVNTMTRAECWAQFADANGSSPARIGESVYVTGESTYQLVNIPVTAGTTLPPGSYTFRTMCRLADRTSNAQRDDWEFVHANMSVLATAETLGS